MFIWEYLLMAEGHIRIFLSVVGFCSPPWESLMVEGPIRILLSVLGFGCSRALLIVLKFSWQWVLDRLRLKSSFCQYLSGEGQAFWTKFPFLQFIQNQSVCCRNFLQQAVQNYKPIHTHWVEGRECSPLSCLKSCLFRLAQIFTGVELSDSWKLSKRGYWNL